MPKRSLLLVAYYIFLETQNILNNVQQRLIIKYLDFVIIIYILLYVYFMLYFILILNAFSPLLIISKNDKISYKGI